MMLYELKSKYSRIPVQARASAWFLICAFLQKGISVITTPIFTRLLSTSEYGAYSVWNSWLGIVSVFASLNLYYGVFTSGLVKFEDDRKQFSASVISLNFLSCVIWTAVYFLSRQLWNSLLHLSTVQMLAMFLMIWTTSIFAFWSAELRVDYKYRALVLVTLSMAFLQPVLGIILVKLAEDKVTARIIGICFIEALFCIPLFFVLVKKNSNFIVPKYWKYALGFNIPLIPHYLSQVVLNSSDRIMIGRLVGEDKAGIYNLAYSVALMMTLFNTALMQTLEPWMYKKLKENKAKEIAKIAYLSFVGIAIVNLLLIYLAPEIIHFFAPKTYSEAYMLIPPISMSVFFMFQYTFFAVVEFYYKETKMISVATVGGAIINIITNYVFIKTYGYQAAAYTTLLCYFLYVVFHFAFMRKLCRINLHYQIYDIRIVGIITLLFVMFGFSGLFLYKNNWLRYLVIGIIFISVIIERKKILLFTKELLSARKG